MTAARTSKAAQPIPASIPMPDSPVRQKVWYQIYSRLARPSLDWIGVAAAAHACGLLDRVLPPIGDDGTRIIILTFVAALHGVRSFEKVKGVA